MDQDPYQPDPVNVISLVVLVVLFVVSCARNVEHAAKRSGPTPEAVEGSVGKSVK
jgi:hypothetical protein